MIMKSRGLIVCFLLLTLGSSSFGQIAQWDHDILYNIQQHRTPAWDVTMRCVSNSLILAPVVPATLYGVGKLEADESLIHSGAQGSCSFVLSSGVMMGMKYLCGRKRPYLQYDDLCSVTTEGSPSFPSGHTSMAFSTATSLCLQYPRWYVVAPSLLWASAVGFSRMYLGVHYPSDVLVGACLGIATAWITWRLQQERLEEMQMPEWKGVVVPLVLRF